MVTIKSNEGEIDIRCSGNVSQITAELIMGMRHFFQNIDGKDAKKSVALPFLMEVLNGNIFDFDEADMGKAMDIAQSAIQKIHDNPLLAKLDALRKEAKKMAAELTEKSEKEPEMSIEELIEKTRRRMEEEEHAEK